LTGLFLSIALVGCSGTQSAAVSGAGAGDQLRFGVQMARQGLWQEALFRFERANRLDPGNAKILNNLAVAQEANGRFEDALDTYREALRVDPRSPDLKENYARFVDFYESYRPESDSGELTDLIDGAEGTSR
jgi:Flp pilus assembly protein TadD